MCVPPSKRDIELLLKLIANLNMLLKDENVNVVKKAILTMTQLYKVALQVRVLGAPAGAGRIARARFNPSFPRAQWMVKSKVISDLQEACWEMMT
ncbi:hypothetical protein FK519_29095, partial [Klebsiella pneumoniae]|nr:hypothetical protein [Klebsiella pneumoniae]